MTELAPLPSGAKVSGRAQRSPLLASTLMIVFMVLFIFLEIAFRSVGNGELLLNISRSGSARHDVGLLSSASATRQRGWGVKSYL